jgi:hypothetical protein
MRWLVVGGAHHTRSAGVVTTLRHIASVASHRYLPPGKAMHG